MNVIEQLQTFWTSLQTNLPVLQNIEAIVAILIALLSVLYFLFRKIKKPSRTTPLENNPRPHPQKKADPIQHELLAKILLHVLVKQVNDPFIFEYSDMPDKYTIKEISRHIHYGKVQEYLEGSVDEANQIANLEITQKGRYYLRYNAKSLYL